MLGSRAPSPTELELTAVHPYPLVMPPPTGFPPTPPPVVTASVLLFVMAPMSLIAATVMALIGALGGAATDVPLVKMYAGKVALVGLASALVLVMLATADLVLGVYLMKGRAWARRMTVGMAACCVVGSPVTSNPLVIGFAFIVAMVIVGLLLLPTTARTYFALCRRLP